MKWMDNASHTSGVDGLLGPDNYLRLLPAACYDAIPWVDLRLWCHHHARYGLPTQELVAWLLERIAGREAIEIGSGSGDLAHHLGIRATDNHQQEWPDVAALYAALRQPTIRYPDAVERLSAEDAIHRYRPQVVVACWITEWIDGDLPPPPQGGSIYGVKEEAILASGATYILIGNEAIHSRRPLMQRRHESLALPFVRSRGATGNRVYIWTPD